MRLAVKIGTMPCVTRLPAPLAIELSDEKAPAIPFKVFCNPKDVAPPPKDKRETNALGRRICSITRVDRIRIHSETTCILDCRFPMTK
mmetsp:Transcript_15540/g.23580  ORF Transcript_15540/g.23580 Transcript_15540/m.23580 type:complete len:88 (-) Transcript_15540:135-398(-)